MQEKINPKKNFHDKYYKLLLLIPLTILILSVFYMFNFYSENQDFIRKDISLTGGTSVTIFQPLSMEKITQDLSEKLENLNARKISDLMTEEQIAITLETKTGLSETKTILEEYLGYELNEENSSFRFTGSSISEAFYQQLIIAIILAFLMMGVVVFLIFSKNMLLKIYTGIIALLGVKTAYLNIPFVNGLVSTILITLFGIMFYYSFKKKTNKLFPLIFFLISLTFFIFPSFYAKNVFIVIFSILVLLLGIYIKYSIPSFSVILSSTLDIFMTLALVNFLGMSFSRAGIVAFLMIIGYSVDTDILLATKILKRDEGTINQRILGALKTGMTMTLTSLFAVGCALIIVRSFSDVLFQIFSILLIGLSFDLLNTWITNLSILKWWYLTKNETHN
jgi:preprotein translocase subunit SecF